MPHKQHNLYIEPTNEATDVIPGIVTISPNPVAHPGSLAAVSSRFLPMNVSLGILAIIACIAALYLARAFFVPLLIGILASYTLSPVVGWLKACYVPRPVGSALVLLVLVGSVSWIASSMSDDAAAIIKKLPEATRKMRRNLLETRTGPTALQNIQEVAKQLQGATDDARSKPGSLLAGSGAVERSTWLSDYVVAQSSLLFAVISQAPIVLLLSYFLLSSGTHFRRKLVGLVGPSLSRKKEAIHILDGITVQIQRFLLTMLLSNTMVGIATWIAFKALGIEQAGAWGVVAGILHSIPYLGPAAIAVGSGMAAFLQFGTLLDAIAVTGASLLVTGTIGFLFMPWIQSRFANVNAAVLFIALLFFGWLWGAWGLLLGAPLVAIVKVVCDGVQLLRPIGELLGR